MPARYVVGVWHASFRNFQLYAELTRHRTIYKRRLRIDVGDGPRWYTKRWPVGTAEMVALADASFAISDTAKRLSTGLGSRLVYVPIGGSRKVQHEKMRTRNITGRMSE